MLYHLSHIIAHVYQNPPLYLHITSTSKAGLEKAVEKIEEMMKQELPNLVDERRFRRREPEQVERDEFGRRKWPEERIPIDLEPIPGFNLRAQVVGHGGAYVKHIQQETRCRVQIKGRNSGFVEHGTNRESDEPMYLHVAYKTSTSRLLLRNTLIMPVVLIQKRSNAPKNSARIYFPTSANNTSNSKTTHRSAHMVTTTAISALPTTTPTAPTGSSRQQRLPPRQRHQASPVLPAQPTTARSMRNTTVVKIHMQRTEGIRTI